MKSTAVHTEHDCDNNDDHMADDNDQDNGDEVMMLRNQSESQRDEGSGEMWVCLWVNAFCFTVSETHVYSEGLGAFHCLVFSSF